MFAFLYYTLLRRQTHSSPQWKIKTSRQAQVSAKQGPFHPNTHYNNSLGTQESQTSGESHLWHKNRRYPLVNRPTCLLTFIREYQYQLLTLIIQQMMPIRRPNILLMTEIPILLNVCAIIQISEVKLCLPGIYK